jgi:hypothetical protein
MARRQEDYVQRMIDYWRSRTVEERASAGFVGDGWETQARARFTNT